MTKETNPLAMIGLFTVLAIVMIALWQGILPQDKPFTPPQPPPIVGPVTPPAPPVRPATEPGDNLKWITYSAKKSVGDKRWGPVLTDIEQHIDPKHGKTYYSTDNITHGHETTHGINSDIRNSLGGVGKNGFYCLENRAFLLTDPKCRISDAAPLIPKGLRGHRYNLYLIQQARDWNSIPTYIFDEWVAYINGTAVGIDQVKNGLFKNRATFLGLFAGLASLDSELVIERDSEIVVFKNNSSDDAIAPMEFTYYSLAVCLATKQKDPTYFQRHPEFAEFVAFNVRRSYLAYKEAIQMEQFRWDTKLIDTFITAEEARPLRELAEELWGKEFTAKYLLSR